MTHFQDTKASYPPKDWGLLVISLSFSFLIIWGIRDLLAMILASLITAYILFPLTVALEKKGIAKWASLFLITFFVSGLSFILIYFVGPWFFDELTTFAKDLPNLMDRFLKKSQAWIDSLVSSHSFYHFDFKETVENLVNTEKENGTGFSTSIKTLLQSGMTFVEQVLVLALYPVFTLYILYDFKKVCRLPEKLVPGRFHSILRNIETESDKIFSSYFRGMLIVCTFLSFSYSLGLILSGLSYGLLIGVTAGILSFIPYVGGIFGFIASVLICIVTGATWGVWIGVLLTFGIAQFIESYLITPQVVGEKIGIHPIAAILTIVAGGKLFGLMGMFLSLPVTALFWRTFSDYKDEANKE